MYLSSITKKPNHNITDAYPFELPVVKHLDKLEFNSPVTFLVGENGSGKSTLLETIAVGLTVPSIAGQYQTDDNRFSGARKLASAVRFVRRKTQKRSFFFRSEDFVGFVDSINETAEDLDDLKADFSENLQGYGRDLALGMVSGQRNALERRYGDNMHDSSHGEGFFQIFKSRLQPGGLYLIDEPESSLSPLRQLSLMGLIGDMVKQNCQFIIATHSPILMAYPKAVIFDVETNPITPVAYDDCEHVSLTRDFLRSPEQFLRHLMDEED